MKFDQNVFVLVTWFSAIQNGSSEDSNSQNKLERARRFLFTPNGTFSPLFCTTCSLHCSTGYVKAAFGCYLCKCARTSTSSSANRPNSVYTASTSGVFLSRPCNPAVRYCLLHCTHGLELGTNGCQKCACVSSTVLRNITHPAGTLPVPTTTLRAATTREIHMTQAKPHSLTGSTSLKIPSTPSTTVKTPPTPIKITPPIITTPPTTKTTPSTTKPPSSTTKATPSTTMTLPTNTKTPPTTPNMPLTATEKLPSTIRNTISTTKTPPSITKTPPSATKTTPLTTTTPPTTTKATPSITMTPTRTTKTPPATSKTSPPTSTTKPTPTKTTPSTITTPSSTTKTTSTTSLPRPVYYKLTDPCISTQWYCSKQCGHSYVKGPGGCEYCLCMDKYPPDLLQTTTHAPFPDQYNLTNTTTLTPSPAVCIIAKVICTGKCPNGFLSDHSDCLYCACDKSDTTVDTDNGVSVYINILKKPCVQNINECQVRCPGGYLEGPRGCNFCTCK